MTTMCAQGATIGAYCDRALGEVFRDHFRAENIYTCNECHDNIFRLVAQLSEKGVNLKNAKVIFINRDLVATKLFPQAVTAEVNYGWHFHVVLENLGLIYDFDFTSEPLIVPAEEYFTMMFDYNLSAEKLRDYFPSGKPKHRVVRYRAMPRSPDPLNNILIKLIPANDYLKDGVIDRASYYRTTNKPHSITIRDFLTRAPVK